MGQCVSRKQFGPRGPSSSGLHYDSASLLLQHHQYAIYCNGVAGQSGSKGKRREAGADGGRSASKGVATSFGFRRRVVSASRVRPSRDDTDDRRRAKTPTESRPLDRNGNGGSSEDVHLYGRDALSGRSTPLARPRKEAAGVPLRTNRFGFRQSSLAKTAKVGDSGVTAGQAFTLPKETECKYNNNSLEKTCTKSTVQYPPLPYMTTQISPKGITNLTTDTKPVTKQTIILTYQTQQYPTQPTSTGRNRSVGNTNRVSGDTYSAPRSSSASRASAYEREGHRYQAGKYTLQTQQLPKPQYPAIKVLDSKSAKQVSNNARKVSGSSDGSSREGSATEDSGVSVTGESCVQDGSPQARRRPRNLEMVMKGAHSFHLRELHVQDLDIMDEAVVTEVAVIPLPKLPSAFYDTTPSDPPQSTFPTYAPSKSIEHSLPGHVPSKSYDPSTEHILNGQPMTTLERYRNQRLARSKFLDSKEETKLVLDRVQCEKPHDKQNTFIGSRKEDRLINTSPVSKESSPSGKSEESSNVSSCSEGLLWGQHAAGESLANRSQDDVSFALSLSGCEDRVSHKYLPEDTPTPAPHPMLMKSLTLSQHSALQSMMGSMSSSNYSGTNATLTTSVNDLNLTLTIADSKFDMEASTLSLIDDETSPADSLISQSSTDSNNDNLEMDASMSMLAITSNVEREPPSMSSSAYQTANTKKENDGLFDATLEEELLHRNGCDEMNSKDVSPRTPGTPTHTPNSLSLSDAKDYFDDEIADQPALLFHKNNTNQEEVVDETEAAKMAQERPGEPSSPPPQKKNRTTKTMSAHPQRTSSLDTLSSIASDDLMMDMDLGHSITSLHSVEEFVERLGDISNITSSWGGSETSPAVKNNRKGLDSSLRASRLGDDSESLCAVTRWNQLLERNNALDRQLEALGSTPSTPTPAISTLGATLPSRTARLLSRSRANTPDTTVPPVNTGTVPAPPADPAALVQDVVDIKTLLLQLKRVLQEPAEEHNSKMSETLDPLLAARACQGNGALFMRLADIGTAPTSDTAPDHCADLKRQILFLQSQVEERDRMVRWLHSRVERLADEPVAANGDTHAHAHVCTDTCNHTCNAATQTDRLRPPTITSNLLQSDNSSGLVSWNEQVGGGKAPGEITSVSRVKKNITNGTSSVRCQCGNILNGTQNNSILNNGTQNGDTYVGKLESLTKTNGFKKMDNPFQLKPNARVGSRYLQAVINKDLSGTREVSCNSASPKNPLSRLRSKSIENFYNQNLSTNEHNDNSNVINLDFSPGFNESNSIKHHTSYSDLFCRTNGREIKSNGSSNSHLTDTDDNSDSGYKSLPPSMNLSNGKKVSAIPRLSMEARLAMGKYNNSAKTNVAI